MNKKNEIIYVFIDASNLWEVQKSKGKLFDYRKFTNFIKNKFDVDDAKIFYYSAYPGEGTRENGILSKQKFFLFLENSLGFTVRKKKLKRIIIYSNNRKVIMEKGNMDVEITIDAIHNIDKYNTAILCSGDSDFLALVGHLKVFGKKVYIFSSVKNISEELRTGGDGYFEILDIEDNIWL